MQTSPDQLVFITGYLGSQIEEWARSRYDLPMAFVEQPEMRGQTDAIIRAREIVTDDALILFPDMLFEADFSVIDRSGADVIMFTKEVDDPSVLGVAVTEGDRIVKLVEKPRTLISRLAVIGIYYVRHMPSLYLAIEEQMRRGISMKNEYFIADAIQLMIDGGAHVAAAPVTEWEDCGNDVALLATNRFLLDRTGESQQRDTSVILPPSYVDESAVIERSVVGPYASIGKGVHVTDAIVRDAIVDEGATVQNAIVESSIVGRHAVVTGRSARINVGDTSRIEL